jgi:hypothetical protein
MASHSLPLRRLLTRFEVFVGDREEDDSFLWPGFAFERYAAAAPC